MRRILPLVEHSIDDSRKGETSTMIMHKSGDFSPIKAATPNSTRNPEESFMSEDSLATEDIQEVDAGLNDEIDTKLIRMTRPFRTRWDLFTMLLAIYNCFTVPFFVAFRPPESTALQVVNTLIDFIFLIDVGLNFFTTYVDRNGDEILELKKIVRNYLKFTF